MRRISLHGFGLSLRRANSHANIEIHEDDEEAKWGSSRAGADDLHMQL